MPARKAKRKTVLDTGLTIDDLRAIIVEVNVGSGRADPCAVAVDRQATGLQDAAPDFFGALLEVRMAGAQVAPGTDDRDPAVPDQV